MQEKPRDISLLWRDFHIPYIAHLRRRPSHRASNANGRPHLGWFSLPHKGNLVTKPRSVPSSRTQETNARRRHPGSPAMNAGVEQRPVSYKACPPTAKLRGALLGECFGVFCLREVRGSFPCAKFAAEACSLRHAVTWRHGSTNKEQLETRAPMRSRWHLDTEVRVRWMRTFRASQSLSLRGL